MDTMSLHMAISGLTGFQRTLWMACKLGKKRGLQDVKQHLKKAGQKKQGPSVCAHDIAMFANVPYMIELLVKVTPFLCRLAPGTG